MKTSKKVRAFIYRIIAVAACFTMLATPLLGREAFVNLQREGIGTMTGSIYYLTEFREYISTLYTYAMLGYAGIGDDQGEPLEAHGANTLKNEYISKLKTKLRFVEEDLACFLQVGDATKYHLSLNTLVFATSAKRLLLPEGITLCCYWNGSKKELQFFPSAYSTYERTPADYYSEQYQPSNDNIQRIQLVLGYVDDGDFTSGAFKEFDAQARSYQRILLTFFISAALTVISGILSLLTRKAGQEARKDYCGFTRGLYPEIKILLLLILWKLCYDLHLWHFNGILELRIFATGWLWVYPIFGAMLYLLYTDWKLNRRSYAEQSLLCALVRFLRNYQKHLPWYRKLSNIYIYVRIASILLLLAAVVLYAYPLNTSLASNLFATALLIAGIILWMYSIRLKRFMADTKAMTEKINALRNGHSNTPLTVTPKSLLTQAAMDVNALEQGIEAAVEENNRSNRMRVELITNVSHDLKTPLTSIINYADLLCEEQLPAPASEYADSLRAKAYRLKSMVQDVFEISKATSGNLPVENVRLDLAKLVRQTLADMDERIQDSTLTFKLHIISEPLMIEADGERLYRVFQNLIVNALQYSLEHSRVYVQLDQEDGYAYAKIKNTSRDELDFKPEDIVERFVRRDTSRTTEGSGLGLSIVQSFTEACGGTFSLDLDADLFTVSLRFPLAASDSQGESDHEDIEATSFTDK